MKKTVLTFGLISAALSTLMMLAGIPFIDSDRVETADVLGYTSIVLSALLVFFGIRSYREQSGAAGITFGRGFTVGMLITLVSCACYVVAFQIVYFKVVPELGQKFASCMVERVRASGGTQQEIDATTKQAETFKGLYDRPVTNAALTFATSFPIGLAVTLVSAAILRRR